MQDTIIAEFSNAFWVDKNHTAFHVDVNLSSGESYPFTYIVDGSDDNDGIISKLTKEAYINNKIEIQSGKEITTNDESEFVVNKSEEIRSIRKQLLFETDFYMIQDYPISEEDRNLIKIYRQALRDVPQQSGFPENVVWPIVPDCIKDKITIEIPS